MRAKGEWRMCFCYIEQFAVELLTQAKASSIILFSMSSTLKWKFNFTSLSSDLNNMIILPIEIWLLLTSTTTTSKTTNRSSSSFDIHFTSLHLTQRQLLSWVRLKCITRHLCVRYHFSCSNKNFFFFFLYSRPTFEQFSSKLTQWKLRQTDSSSWARKVAPEKPCSPLLLFEPKRKRMKIIRRAKLTYLAAHLSLCPLFVAQTKLSCLIWGETEREQQ